MPTSGILKNPPKESDDGLGTRKDIDFLGGVCLSFIREHCSFGHLFGHTGHPNRGFQVPPGTPISPVPRFSWSPVPTVPRTMRCSVGPPIPRRYGHTEPSQTVSNPLRPDPYRGGMGIPNPLEPSQTLSTSTRTPPIPRQHPCCDSTRTLRRTW